MSSILSNKPLIADDITNIDDAKKELKRIRKLMQNFHRSQENINRATAVGGVGEGGKVKKVIRNALHEEEHIKDYVKKDIPKSDAIRKLIYDAIKPNVLFELNTEDELEDLIDIFEARSFEAGDTVIKQGEKGETFYVVESGELSISVSVAQDDKEDSESMEVNVGYYSEGSAFGELALIYGSPRAATIRAVDNCRLWRIKRGMYRGVVGQHRQRLHEEKLKFLPNVNVGARIFRDVFEREQMDTMAQLLKQAYYKKGDVILREGEEGDTFYMIQSGEVDIFKKALGDIPIAKLGKEKFFGEKALLSDDVRQATVVAASAVTCYVLTRGDFVRMLGDLQDILDGKVTKKRNRASQIHGESKVAYKLNELIILNVLGEGAFGKVRVAKAKDTGKCYALKAQRKDFIVNGQKDYILYEYRLMKELSHPFILNLHCAMQDSRYIYFLLDLLPGGEVMDILQQHGRFTERLVRFYSASVS